MVVLPRILIKVHPADGVCIVSVSFKAGIGVVLFERTYNPLNSKDWFALDSPGLFRFFKRRT